MHLSLRFTPEDTCMSLCELQIAEIDSHPFGCARAVFRPIHAFLRQNKGGQLGPRLERMSAHLLPLTSPFPSRFPFPSFLFLFSSSVNDCYDLSNIDHERARRRFHLPPAFKFTASQLPTIYSPGAFPIILLTTSSHLPRNTFS